MKVQMVNLKSNTCICTGCTHRLEVFGSSACVIILARVLFLHSNKCNLLHLTADDILHHQWMCDLFWRSESFVWNLPVISSVAMQKLVEKTWLPLRAFCQEQFSLQSDWYACNCLSLWTASNQRGKQSTRIETGIHTGWKVNKPPPRKTMKQNSPSDMNPCITSTDTERDVRWMSWKKSKKLSWVSQTNDVTKACKQEIGVLHLSHFSPFNCCLSVGLSLEKGAYPS